MAEKQINYLRQFDILLAARKAAKNRKLVWIAISLIVLLLFLFIFGGHYGLINIFKLNKEKKVLQQDIEKLKKEGEALKQDIEKLKTDKKEVERIARENYGMAKKGEKVFKFVKPNDKNKKKD